MPGLSHKILLYAASGALGGSAAWAFILMLSSAMQSGLFAEIMLGALTGMFIGGFIWSHEALTGRQFRTAARRAGFGATGGAIGGAVGAGLGSTVFTLLGRIATELGGFKASLGIAMSVGLGWAVLGAFAGASGGIMVRSRERALYGLGGGFIGGLCGGLLFYNLSATNIWSALAGLFLLGMCIGAFISLVEEAFVSAKVKVVKGRHLGREFPILKDLNVIGRDDRSDVCLSGAEGVGLEHAFIRRKNGSYVIEQGKDGTGVYVNHKLTKSIRLCDGDMIRVGSVILMFQAIRKAAAAAVVMLFLLIGIHDAKAEEALQMQITQFDLSAFPVVKAYVSILDRNNRPVQGLDFRIVSLKENGLPVSIKEMRPAGTPGKKEPLSLSIVLDKSGSMTGNKIRLARESALRFITLMEKGDRAALFAFSDEVAELAPLTGDLERLKNDVAAIQPGGHTALYDAILRGADSLKGSSGRRAVVVLTDGIANRGTVTIEQAVNAASAGNVSVYVIGLGEDVRTARLERISLETGGTYFFTPSEEGLAAIYETISRRIRNEYVVTYNTEKRGEYLRNVSIELKGGPKAGRMYFQPRSSLFGAGGEVPGWAFGITLASVAGLIGISLRKIERQYKAGHLSVVKGKASKTELDIISTVSLGRDERNSLGLFRDSAVEQYHAEVRRENGKYVIEDKGSASGTFVNDNKISRAHALADGDIISIGGARIVFSEESRGACAGCGGAVRANAKFCPKCGAKTP